LRCDHRTAAFRPIEASKAVVCYVGNTSTPDLAADLDQVRNPPEAAAPVKAIGF